MNNNDYSYFKKICLITLIAVYFLILVGGIVRSTGSGMGCPDWPKCFGKLVPPVMESELPENYQEIYARKRAEKNDKLSGYLEKMGFKEKANEIRNDPAIQLEARFNVYKTWTEYINRLVGVTIGILIFLTLLASFPLRKKSPGLLYLSLLTFLLVGFQGWIGSVVVSTNLLPWMVTVHMVLAMIIVFLLIYLYHVAEKSHQLPSMLVKFKIPKTLFIACLVLTFTQVITGTQVREMMDLVAAGLNYTLRDTWVSKLGSIFLIHRSFSILLLVLHIYLGYLFYKELKLNPGRKKFILVYWLVIAVVLEILTGTAMAYFAIPKFLQPVHLLLALLIVGLQYYLILQSSLPKAVKIAEKQ